MGIIIGWFIFSGGSVEIELPDFNIRVDTTYKSYTDTITVTRTKVKFDTLRAVDSIIIVQHDSIYPCYLTDAMYPVAIGNNLYLTPSFESKFELVSHKDTVKGIYYFPNMAASAAWIHGQDSLVWNERVIYKDYWYNNMYVEGSKDLILVGIGILINELTKAKK